MILTHSEPIVYPDSDGKGMAENTLQYKWITAIKGGLHAQFRNRDDVFVAGDLFWYPVEGDNKTCTAPDTMVVFGRPPGHRMSYMQWLEEDIPPQVVIEILSKSNAPPEMVDKLAFYERFGVEEYYVYNPFKVTMKAYFRQGTKLKLKPVGKRFRSPLLDVTFELGRDLTVFGSNGRTFVDYPEVVDRLEEEERRANREARKAIMADFKAQEEAKRAFEETKRANEEARRADEETKRANDLERRLNELLAKQAKSENQLR